MVCIVIVGFKISFKHLWKKVGTIEKPSCGCSATGQNYIFCPHCGTRNRKQTVKLYRSRITGAETTWRSLDALKEYLQKSNLAIYDGNPRGYTDDNVYIYFTDPHCYIESAGSETTSPKMNKALSKLEDWMFDFIEDELWNLGEFGVWVLEKEKEPVPPVTTTPAKPATPMEAPQTRTFIIPLGPHME